MTYDPETWVGRPPVDPIQKATDDYLAMQRKAAAWDMLYWLVKTEAAQGGERLALPPSQLLANLDKIIEQQVIP